jgi:DNA-binding response OmpR family regulator
MQRLLLVENDLSLAKSLKQLLINAGYAVEVASSLETAYVALGKQGFELVITDRILDDGDGIELVSFLQDVSYETRVLVLSQRNQDFDRVSGLEDGADDYLGKPFSTREFLLRVSVLAHRQKMKNQEYLQLGEVILHPSSGFLKMADSECRLRKRESQILACLLRRQGSVVSKNHLIESVWQSEDAIPTYTTVEVYIRRLRMALGKQQSLIKTIRGFGYMASP